jgi:putative phosphoesterase
MLFAVASDIHDHLPGWRALWPRLAAARPDALILCGDLSRPGTLEALHPGIAWAFCLGNCDAAEAPRLRKAGLRLGATVWGDEGLWALPEGGSLAFTHFPARAQRLAESGAHKAVFFGHSHRPSEAWVGSCLLANPGDVQGRYGRVGGLLWDSVTGRLDWVEA